MKLLQPADYEGRLKRVLKTYSELIRIGIIFLFWSTVAFVTCCAGYLIIRMVLAVLHMLLKAIGRI
jgi:hypothetical protein